MLDEKTLSRVLKTVRFYLSPVYDCESIAMDILIESWENEVEHPPRSFIRQRCYDVLRRSRMEKDKGQKRALWREQARQEDRSLEERDQVERLVMVLEPLERKIIWYRFYADLPLVEIGKKMKMDVGVVRERLAGALYKMRVEGLEDE